MAKNHPNTIKFRGATYRLAVSEKQISLSLRLKQLIKRRSSLKMVLLSQFELSDIDQMDLADPGTLTKLHEELKRAEPFVDFLKDDLKTALSLTK